MQSLTLPGAVRCLQKIQFPHKLGICERMFGRTLSSLGTGWVQTGAGIEWKLDLSELMHRWVVYGKYEGNAFIDWARAFLPADGIVVDSGANIGQMLIYLAQYVPRGKVLAFEPGNHQADWLEECLRIQKQLPVELVRRGLGSARDALYLAKLGSNEIHGAWDKISTDGKEPIEVVPLMEELALRGIETVDLWKLDVEGYEIPALQGAEKLLREKRVRAIYIELAGDNGVAIRNYLSRFDYECYLIGNNRKLRMPVNLPDFTNGLFLPSHRPANHRSKAQVTQR